MGEVTIRAIRADEWRAVRELRLRALRDEAAGVAFLDTFASAAERPDGFWIARAAGASSDAGADARSRQFVAVAPDGTWVGSVSVIRELAGEADYAGIEIRRSGGVVVGVYVDPGFRGQGLIERLLDAAADWVRELGLDAVRLTVHADNLRAQAAYRKGGFQPTGVAHDSSIGRELEMARTV